MFPLRYFPVRYFPLRYWPPLPPSGLEDFSNIEDLQGRCSVLSNSQILMIPEATPSGLLTGDNRLFYRNSISFGVDTPLPVTIIYKEIPLAQGSRPSGLGAVALFDGMDKVFGGGWGITTFTCESRVSISVDPETKLKVHQIIFANPTSADSQIAYGGT